MNEPITLTLNQVYDGVMAICAIIISVAAVVGIAGKIKHRATAPERVLGEKVDEIEQRVVKIEERVDEHDEYFKSDKKRLESIEEGNKATQKAILALLAHGIDGNEIQSMKDAKSELENYLINR